MKNQMKMKVIKMKAIGRPSKKLKALQEQLEDHIEQEKSRNEKTKAAMDYMDRWTNIYLTIHQKRKLLEYAAEVNERDEDDIMNMNQDADAI